MAKLRKNDIIAFVMLSCLFLVTLSGCDGVNKKGSKVSDDGRSYGGVCESVSGQKLHTAFFDWTVNSATPYKTYQFGDGLYQAEEGMVYLEVSMTVCNTYAQDILMSSNDFAVRYTGMEVGERLSGYGRDSVLSDSFMEEKFTLKKGEEITKSILYMVPEYDSYVITYNEYYADGFVGDIYNVTVNP